MKRNRNDTPVIASLSRNNDPPSDDQRVFLSTNLKELEAEFQLVAGKAFSSELEESQIPRAAKGPRKAIQLRRTLLCGVRSIPDELLQTILEFVVFDEKGASSYDPEVLQCLCGVSRRWRQAAIGHAILWTQLTPINFMTTKRVRIRMTTDRLKVYLTRSGDLPISFNLWLYYPIWEKSKDLVLEPLQLLMDQCHRWDKILLQTPLIFEARMAVLAVCRGRSYRIGHRRGTHEAAPMARRTEGQCRDRPSQS